MYVKIFSCRLDAPYLVRKGKKEYEKIELYSRKYFVFVDVDFRSNR